METSLGDLKLGPSAGWPKGTYYSLGDGHFYRHVLIEAHSEPR